MRLNLLFHQDSELEFSLAANTAPAKPSKQTQILLDQMSRSQDDEKSRWYQVMENFDLLFTKMNDIGGHLTGSKDPVARH